MRADKRATKPERRSETEAAGLAPEWPMSVDAFLEGNHIDRADVMLTRRHGSIFSWLIRWATKSQFSHAALVFLVPYREREYTDTFVIEAGTKGVDLTNLEDYVKDRASVVAIKRFRSATMARAAVQQATDSWFDENVQKVVRGRMLNKIKSKYNFGKIFAIGFELLDQMVFGMRERVQGRQRAIASRRKKGKTAPNEFICSGLVQLGFVEAVGELVRAGRVPPIALKEVVFLPEIAGLLPDDWENFTDQEVREIVDLFVDGWRPELEAIKPIDLAASEHLEWRFVIIDGWVHRVRSVSEAYALLEWEPDFMGEPMGA